jgi:hypothetical protein
VHQVESHDQKGELGVECQDNNSISFETLQNLLTKSRIGVWKWNISSSFSTVKSLYNARMRRNIMRISLEISVASEIVRPLLRTVVLIISRKEPTEEDHRQSNHRGAKALTLGGIIGSIP